MSWTSVKIQQRHVYLSVGVSRRWPNCERYVTTWKDLSCHGIALVFCFISQIEDISQENNRCMPLVYKIACKHYYASVLYSMWLHGTLVSGLHYLSIGRAPIDTTVGSKVSHVWRDSTVGVWKKTGKVAEHTRTDYGHIITVRAMIIAMIHRALEEVGLITQTLQSFQPHHS